MSAHEIDIGFRRHMESYGIEPPAEIACDGKMHRAGTKGKPRGKDGAYIAHVDPPASIWCMNHRTQESGAWTAKSASKMSPAERAAFKQRVERDRAAREEATAALHAEKAALAQRIYENAPDCPADHSYLVNKGVPPLGGLRLTEDGRIIAPVLGDDGKIQSLQFIADDGTKRFLTGGKMAGGFFAIKATGDKAGPLRIAEGYATGATVHQAAGETVLCAFNAGNLLAVAEMARRFYPDREIIVCADDDLTEGNPGLTKATEAARAINARLAVPVFLDHAGRTDFNDMHAEQGLDAVRAILDRATVPEQAPASITVSESFDDWEPPTRKPWPVLDKAALPGLAGEFVALATDNSEADPAAVLTTFMVRFACEAGGPDPATRPHMFIGDSRHEPRLFAVVAGQSSKARKGTSAAPVARLFELGDVGLPMAATSPGPLSSGEGIVFHVRDELREWTIDKKTGAGMWVVKDPGISDKRLSVGDEELAAGLRCTKREGNTLSTALRGLWDNGTVHPLTKSSPTKCTRAHVNIVAHITLEELGRVLDDVELFNGFANRFLWTLARRTRLVARPRPMPARELAALQGVLVDKLRFAHTAGLMAMDAEACSMWEEVYPFLSVERGGLFGAVVGRAEAQVQRLAMVYALVDGKSVVNTRHLAAALAFWNYCEASAAYIFEGRQADPLREKILAALRTASKPMTATELHRALGNSFSKEQLQTSLGSLTSDGLVIHEKEPTKTKPRNLFRLSEKSELSEFFPTAQTAPGNNSENSENSPVPERNSIPMWDGPDEVEI